MKVSNIIRELRTEKKLSQKDLALSLGITNSTVSDWERDRSYPTINQLSLLADFFKCTVDYILGRENDYGIVEVKNELSEAEQFIVNAYRKADRNGKALLYGYAGGIVEHSNKIKE